MKRVRARRLASLLTVIVLLLAFGLMAAYATGGSVARAEELLGAPTDDPCVWKNADDYYVKFSDGTVPYKFSSSSPFVYSSWDDVGYALGTTWQVEVYTDAACETEHSSKPDLCFAEHESDANAFGSVLSPENLTEEKIGLFDVLLYTGSYGSATFTPRAKVVIAVGIEIEDTSVTVSYHYDANLTFVYGDEEGFDALAAADYYDMIDVSGDLGDKTKAELFTLTFKKGSRSGEGATLTARAAVDDYYLVVSSNDDSFDFSFSVNEDENAFIRVTPKEIAVNWTNLSFGYDGQPHVPTATLTASDLEEDDEVGLSAVTGAQVDANANHVATTQLIGDGAANYTLTNPSTTFAITKAALTLTIESKVTVYGDLVAFSAIKEGETYDSDDSIFTFVCVDGEDQPIGASTGVGVYDISLAFGERAANYDITVTEEKATYTVNRRAITVAIDAKTSVYGAAPKALSARVTDGSIVKGDSAPYVLACGVTATSSVGEYAIGGSVENTNYDITFDGNAVYTVTPATLQGVSVQDVTLTYNGAAQSPNVTVSATAVNGMPVTFTYSLAEAGEYGALPTFRDYAEGGYTVCYKATAPNHTEASGSFTVTVAKRAITVAIDAKTSVYGEEQVALSAQVTSGSVIEGDAPYVLACEGVTNTASVGEYDVIGTPNDGNYDVTFVGGAKAYSVTPATLQGVSVQADALTYNGAAQAPVVTAAATAVNGQAVTFTYSLTENGEYGAPPTFKDYAEGGYIVYYKATAANHTEASGSFTVTVNKRKIYLTIDPKSSVYGEKPLELSAQVTNGSIVEGENAPYVLECKVTSTTAVGSYSITGTGTNDNYAITFFGESDAYTVTPATLRDVAVQDVTLTYNGKAQSVAAITAATSTNETPVTFTYSLTEEGEYGELPTFRDYAEGGYTVYYKAVAENHYVAEGSFTVTVAKRAITVAIDTKTSTYGATPLELTARVTDGSVVAGDDAPYVLECNVTSTTAVGSYAITGTGTNDNYAITFFGESDAYTVTPATLGDVSVRADALTYNGAAQTSVVTPAASSTNETPVTFTYCRTENGEYGALPTFRDYADGGYTVYYKATAPNHTEARGTFTVTVNKRKIYLTIDPKSSVYGEKPLELSAQVTNGSIVEGENAPYVLECNVTATTAVGSYAISGTGTNDNYAITFFGESDAYTVTPATLRDVSVQDVTLTYNGKAQSVAAITAASSTNETPVTFTYSLTENGEYGELLTFKDYAEGGYTVYYKAVAENHYAAEGSFTVTVAKRAITVAIDSKASTYGATPLELTARVTVGSVAEGDAVPYALACEGATNTAVVGSYAIDGGVENTNYDITFEGNAFYTVTPATLRDVSVRADALTYNGAAQTPVVTPAATAANELPVTFTYSRTENGEYGELPTFKDYAEGGYTVYYKATAPNHAEASGSFNVTVNKRKIFLTIDPKSSVYGEKPLELSAQVTNGSIVEGEKAPYVLECKVTQTTAVGSYAITGTGTNDNYAVVFVGESNAYTVTPATLGDVSVRAASLTYNGEAQTPAVTPAATAVNGQAVAFTYALSENGAYGAAIPAFTDWKEGGYTVYFKATAANHAEASGSFTVTIDRIPVALNLYVDGRLVTEAVKLVYDGTEHTFVVKAAGVQGDVITLSEKASSTVFAVKDRVIDAKALAADGKEIENYLLVEAFCVPDHEIVKKAITVTAEAKAVTYGDADAALTARVTDENGAYRFPSGVSASDVYALARAAGRTAGTYAITVIPANNANYDVTATDGVYTIGKKPLVVTADDKESGYRESLASLTVTLDATVAEGDAVYVIRTTADADKVGTYPITLTATEYGAANYALTLVNGTYTVRAKAPELVETEDGKTVVEHEEEISVEEVKTEGVSITEMINNAIESSKADDVDEVTLTLKITDETAEEGAEDAVVPTVTFNKAALEQLKDQLANGTLSDVKITYEEKSAEQIDRNDEKTKSAELVLEISLQGASFEGGVATITTRFENKAPRGKKAVLYYVDADGNKTDMNATFEGGALTFETGHFSTYVVEYVLTGGSVSGIAIGCTVGTACIAFCLWFFLLRRKGARRTQETRTDDEEAIPAEGDNATPSEVIDPAATESDAPAESASSEPTPESSAETASTVVPTTPSHTKKGGKKGKKGKR